MNQLENTPENKAAFFALYLGQKVYKRISYPIDSPDNVPVEVTGAKIGNTLQYNSYPYSHLELRSIDSLTDEELKWFAHFSAYRLDDKNILRVGKVMVKSLFQLNGWSGSDISKMCDYLRSISVFIPYMGESDKLIEWGWVVVKAIN